MGKKNYYPLRSPSVVPVGELCLPVGRKPTRGVRVRTYICCIRLSFLFYHSVLGLLCRLHGVESAKLMALDWPTAMSDRRNTFRRQRVVTPARSASCHINNGGIWVAGAAGRAGGSEAVVAMWRACVGRLSGAGRGPRPRIGCRWCLATRLTM